MSHLYKSSLVAVFLLTYASVFSQKPYQPNASDIYQSIKKLNVLGNVLYLAAHPDDENTRLIAYMANEELVNTAYLSLTRGDGGQNLVGAELREGLGVIRTQELLTARQLDGGEQFFTRANDFGYSKNADETLKIWDKDKVLHDMVWVIRKFRPDVIITRFPPDNRGRHGHHTASAMLAMDAYDLAGNKNAYPSQLKKVPLWTPKRILINTGRWWNSTITADTEGVVTIDVGKYNSTLGKSYTEIAALSRSQHKSQGFGATGTRGEQIEFLEHLKGQQANKNVWDGIDKSWGRVSGGGKVQPIVTELISTFDINEPEKSIGKLIALKKSIQNNIKDDFWKNKKLLEINKLLVQCSGIYIEAVANHHFGTPDEEVAVKLEMINRAGNNVIIKKLIAKKVGLDSAFHLNLLKNKRTTIDTRFTIPNKTAYSQPYWLEKKGTEGMYAIDNKDTGKPQNEPSVQVTVDLEIENEKLHLNIPVVYKWNDPVKGELYRPFDIVPPLSINIFNKINIFKNNQKKEIRINIKSFKNNIKTIIKPIIPRGWSVTTTSASVQLKNKGDEQQITFNVTSPSQQQTVGLVFEAEVNGKTYRQGLQEINYDHIPSQIILTEAVAHLVNIDLQIAGSKIAYIHGAGDAVPQGLRNMGYQVDELENGQINLENLQKYDAVVLGIRALNTNKRIPFYMDELMKYTHEGGTLVMQYNTAHRLKTNEFSPYPIKLSRDRVTLESAEVRFLLPKHKVLNTPNKITSNDFDNWVQERGLYFPNEWDDKYAAILSTNDPNEPPRNGSLLIASYGKGYYVYTGLSFFRELPAGVPGAYRLFANIVSLSKSMGVRQVVDNEK